MKCALPPQLATSLPRQPPGMSSSMYPLIPPSVARPPVDRGGRKSYFNAMLRDNFTFQTWILIGGAVGGTSFLLAGPWAVYGVLAIYCLLGWKVLEAVIMTMGWIPNRWLSDTIPEKFCAQLPPQDSEDNGPGSSGFCLFLLGARFNHPMGLLAPGVKEIADWAEKCYEELRNLDEYGLLGMSNYIGTEREANNHVLTLMYFRTTAGLHRFALSQVHKDTWNWWLEIQKKYPHLAIMHETYDVPPKHWETIYVHHHKAGLGGASVKMEERDEEGRVLWWSTPVNAAKGKFRSSKGRLGWTEGDDNEEVGFVEYH